MLAFLYSRSLGMAMLSDSCLFASICVVILRMHSGPQVWVPSFAGPRNQRLITGSEALMKEANGPWCRYRTLDGSAPRNWWCNTATQEWFWEPRISWPEVQFKRPPPPPPPAQRSAAAQLIAEVKAKAKAKPTSVPASDGAVWF